MITVLSSTTETVFTDILSFCYRLFDMLYSSASVIWDKLATPVAELFSISGIAGAALGDITLVEFMLGAGLSLFIVWTLIKWFIGLD